MAICIVDFAAIAARILSVSRPFSVCTRWEMARAITIRLATTPSRFQPTCCLTPRPTPFKKTGIDTMGVFTNDIKTMDDLFVHQLQDIYYAEKQLLKALPKMADKAAEPLLKQAFKTHLQETEVHVQRLEQVFAMHGAE